MPTFSLPTLSNASFHDGTPISVGDECVPVVFVVDSNGKTVSAQGSPITISSSATPSFVSSAPAKEPRSEGSGGT